MQGKAPGSLTAVACTAGAAHAAGAGDLSPL